MTKTELKQFIKECLQEELAKTKQLTEAPLAAAAIDNLLATKIEEHPDFENACMTGDAAAIMQIVDSIMAEENLYSPGAKTLRNNIFRKTKGKPRIPVSIGADILKYVWNSTLSAYDLNVI